MRITIKATMIFAAIFAVICFGVAISGFSSLGDITDPTQAADTRGFAWFFVFLAGVAITFALLSWWIARKRLEDEDA